MKQVKHILEGSRAISKTIRNINPAVVSAYPITPQTHIVEDLAKLKANGEADYEYVRAESEFAAASIVLGASASGVRTYSATSSQGLLLMAEVVFNIAGMRLPVVMTCANRAVSAPINIWCFNKTTKILMADLTYKPIDKVKIGEKVIGKDKNGKIVYSVVTKLFNRYTENLVKIKTDQTETICTPEHLFYYHPGHNHWVKAKDLKNKKLHYFGLDNEINDEFKRGWLAGVADGDGCFYTQTTSHNFRLKCKDEEMAQTFVDWSNDLGHSVRRAKYMEKFGYFIAILTLTEKAKILKKFLTKGNSRDFARGYLAGIYDAEGSGPFKVKQAVIYNNDIEIVNKVSHYLKLLKMSFKVYKDTRRGGKYKNDNYHIKINNVPEFFIQCPPRISRKRNNLLKMSLKSIKSRLKVTDVIQIKQKTKVYNFETETNNYVADGFLVHNCDHSDVMAVRDAGWIQLFAATAQEMVDTHILAYKIAEKLQLPVMVNVDGFILTHSYEAVLIPEAKEIKKYLPDYKPTSGSYLDPSNPVTMGAFFTPAHYLETRENLQTDLLASLAVIKKEYRLFKKTFDRKNNDNGLIEYLGPKKPELILVALGSVVGTIQETLKKYPQVGLLKIKTYRPFPAQEIFNIIKRTKNIAVIEKAVSLGSNGPLYADLKSSFPKNFSLPNVRNYIVGLGGRDVTSKMIAGIISDAKKSSQKIKFIGK